MRLLITLYAFLLLSIASLAQKNVFLNEFGDTIDESKFLKEWRNKDNFYSRWDAIGKNNIRYCKLKKDLYLAKVFEYRIVKENLEKIMGKEIKDNKTILVEFRFTDDLCTHNQDNKWTKSEIFNRKKFLNPRKKQIEKDYNVVYICLFERDIILKNNSSNKNEYFFCDKNNFFKEKVFKNPTLCGSFALIKPNEEMIIRNGEYRSDYMAQHLKPENWDIFFKQ